MDNFVPVIKLGSAKKKKVNKLKRGEGPLVERINRSIDKSSRLTGPDESEEPKQSVIIHYEKKKDKKNRMLSVMKPFKKKKKKSLFGIRKKDLKKVGLRF